MSLFFYLGILEHTQVKYVLVLFPFEQLYFIMKGG